MASICLGGIITLERTEAWPIASAPRPPRTRDGKSNKKRKEEKEKGEKTCRKSPTGINPSSLVMNKKNIKDPTTSLFYSQIFTLEKVDEEYWGGT